MRSYIDFNQVFANSKNTLSREYFRPLESQFTCEKKETKLMLMLKLSAPSSLS